MKHFFSRIMSGIAFVVLIPIVFTLLIQGSGENFIENPEVITESEWKAEVLEEDILVGIVANEISIHTEMEAIKAQAVVARTNCLRAMKEGEDLPEGLTKGEMIRLWGQENFSDYYAKLERSVAATRGIAMTHNGAYICAEFHKCSGGYTREAGEFYGNESYPYLKSVDARMDITSQDFLKVEFYTPKEFIEAGEDFFCEETRQQSAEKTAQELSERIIITEKDTAGYVKKVSIEGKTYSGEEIRLTYGWNSSDFSLKEVDGKIRVTTKGMGHGLGLSLYGANQLAAEGYTYQDILKYFYTEIEFVSHYD